MNDFKARLQNEFNELSEKTDSLKKFIHSKTYNELSDANKYLLNQQYEIMCKYWAILKARLSAV